MLKGTQQNTTTNNQTSNLNYNNNILNTINMYKNLANGNQNEVVNTILNNNPNISEAVRKHNGNFKEAFLEECRNRNADPAKIISMLK